MGCETKKDDPITSPNPKPPTLSVPKYTVIFNTNGGNTIAPVKVKQGDKLTKPKNPTKNDYFFEGWYKEKNLSTLFDFDKEIINANTTIYAEWKKIEKLVFSTTSVVSSLQLKMSSSLEIKTVGAVIRLATERAPTKAVAEASAGYVNLRIDADSTRKFSISQHYLTNFTDGLTLDDVLAPNTNYKLYLFLEPNAIPSGTLIEGATLTNDVIVLSFATASLPSAGDTVWDDAWKNEQFVGSISEWSYGENQKGVFVAYVKVKLGYTSIVVSDRTASNTLLQSIGSLSIGSVIADPNFLFNIAELGGGYPRSSTYPNYYYVIGADDTGKMSGKSIQVEIANLSQSVAPQVPITRYSRP